MSGRPGELFASYSAVQTRREWEIGLIKEKLGKNEAVDLPVCRVEKVSGDGSTLRFGLKRGKLLYLFRYPHHDVEREKHRNVITRARFIKAALEDAGYTLIPWDFKKGKPPTFWEERTMDEEDDDLYGPSETAEPKEEKKDESKEDSDGEDGDEPMDEGLESGETDEEEESDSDIDIIIDKPQVVPKPIVQKEPQESKAIKIEAPPQSTSTPSQAPKSTAPTASATAPQQLGTAYPAVRTSNIDVNADPVYPPVGKTITALDIDADLAESSKPWRLPGADQSDYFNYGFDEFSWELYRQRQFTMTSEIAAQKAEMSQLQQMFGGMGAPGQPPAAPAGAPTGPAAQGGGGMGGMVPPGAMSEEQMAMMFQQMAQSGGDPSQMDFSQFMQMAGQQMGPQGGGGGFGGGQGGGAGYGQGNQGGGGGGRGGGGRRGRGQW